MGGKEVTAMTSSQQANSEGTQGGQSEENNYKPLILKVRCNGPF